MPDPDQAAGSKKVHSPDNNSLRDVFESPIRNTPYDNLLVGMTCELERVCAAHDLAAFAYSSGNTSPLDWPGRDIDHDGHDDAFAPTAWLASLTTTALGSLLPGPGTLVRRLDLSFPSNARIGDRLRLKLRCEAKRDRPLVDFSVILTNHNGVVVMEGVATIVAPLESMELTPANRPQILFDSFDHFGPLIDRCKALPALVTGVVWPEDEASFIGALGATQAGLITPIFIGNSRHLNTLAEVAGISLQDLIVEEAEDPQQAAVIGVSLVHSGRVRALMKGSLHSDVLLTEIVKNDGGLRLRRRLSHAFVIDAPTLDHLLFVSDAAINIAPDLMAKVDITQNAIDLAQACGIATPKVGILSAVETVNPAIQSTLDAAILSKMADRGQIHGGIVDGPLAMDNAIDVSAARSKGIASLVAGQADILIVPNLEAGNILAKELTFLGRAESAGLVLGAKVPVILTSRADNDRARLASCALAQLYEYWRLNRAALLSSS